MCFHIVCVYIYISWCARDAAISVIYLCINPCRSSLLQKKTEVLRILRHKLDRNTIKLNNSSADRDPKMTPQALGTPYNRGVPQDPTPSRR